METEISVSSEEKKCKSSPRYRERVWAEDTVIIKNEIYIKSGKKPILIYLSRSKYDQFVAEPRLYGAFQ